MNIHDRNIVLKKYSNKNNLLNIVMHSIIYLNSSTKSVHQKYGK